MFLRGFLLSVFFVVLTFPVFAQEAESSEKQMDLEDVIEAVIGSVARITPVVEDNPDSKDLGSGILIDTKGHVLTNLHVVKNAKSVKVKFPKKRTLTTTKIYSDKRTDLTILKLEENDVKGITPIVIREGKQIRLGASVFAIGSPFGLDGTVTRGIISARNRTIEQFPLNIYLQTDAALNPGNSGGPLFCMNGQCVGIANAIKGDGANVGINFVIDGTQAKFVAEQLIKNGKVIRGYLGAAVRPLTDDQLDDLDADLNIEAALKVTGLVEGDSPARSAGLKIDDLIIEYKGTAITSENRFIHEVAKTEIGSSVKMMVLRNGEKVELTLKVEAHPDSK